MNENLASENEQESLCHIKASLVIWKENKCHEMSVTNICHMSLKDEPMWSSVMSNIACCCKYVSYKLHSIACCCANVYHINWTVLHIAAPAGE